MYFKTVKFSEEDIGEKIRDTRFGNHFSDMTSKHKQ